MRLLFELDAKDYDPNGVGFIRDSARAIIIRDGKVAMIHSLKYDYYKFPGGGIESNESKEEALIRETKEESGLIVVPSSIREYGYVHRIQKSTQGPEDYFQQDNYYYLCDAEESLSSQRLDDYEREERFTLEFVEPRLAIETNRSNDNRPKAKFMIQRECMVLEWLISEGFFD